VEIVHVPTDAERMKRSSSAARRKTTAFIACRAMKTIIVTLRMIHDVIRIALLLSSSCVDVLLTGIDVFGVFMVERRRMRNAQKADPKRNSRKKQKEDPKGVRSEASNRCKHNEGSDPGVKGDVVKRRAEAGPLRIMGQVGIEPAMTRPYRRFS
jgi:hypothetical protein